MFLDGMAAQQVEHQTRDQEFTGLPSGRGVAV